MAQPRQTLTYLRQRFAEIGIRPVTRYGQNFLIDLNLHEVIVAEAKLEPRDVVLEIGTGTGALTALMAEQAGAVVTVEIDPHLYQLASEQLIDLPNVTMIHGDALKNKNHFRPEVLETIQSQLANVPDSRFKLVANLPYNIATPILSNLLLHEPPPYSMTATIQKELGDRIVAEPGTKDYGALSVWIQSQCTARIARLLPPSVFWPRPKVTSAVVQIEFSPERRGRIADLDYWHAFTRKMFFHRRKFLRGVAHGAFHGLLEKETVDEVLASQSLAADARVEQLTVERLLALADAFRQRLPAGAELSM